MQSIAIFLGIVALAFAPLALFVARRLDGKREEAQPDANVPERLQVQAVVARHMYGKAVGHDPIAMFDYDESPALQAMWQAEAGYKLAGR